MKSRIIIGSLATTLFLRQYLTINKIQFQYPYVSQTGKINQQQTPNKHQFKKNTWLLSIKAPPQMFSDRFQIYQVNELVLCETPEGKNTFKIVGATSRNYTRFQNGVSNYIPPGFVFLIDPVKKQIGMVSFLLKRRNTLQLQRQELTLVLGNLRHGGQKKNHKSNKVLINHLLSDKFCNETMLENRQNNLKFSSLLKLKTKNEHQKLLKDHKQNDKKVQNLISDMFSMQISYSVFLQFSVYNI